MKLNKFIAITALGLTAVSCNNNQLKTKKSLETSIDSVSYALGLNTGVRMQADANAKELDADLYLQGFVNGTDSTNLLIEVKDAEAIIRQYFQKKQMEQMKQREEEMKKKAEVDHADYKKENEAFLAANKNKDGVKTTPSGLQYMVIKEGEGDTPGATDKVKVHYHGTLIDGTVFDSSVDKGVPSEFGVNQVIKGWTEGLQLMKTGAKYKFFIPQELAYGYQQRGPILKPFSTLVFEVDLIDIIKPEQPKAEQGK